MKEHQLSVANNVATWLHSTRSEQGRSVPHQERRGQLSQCRSRGPAFTAWSSLCWDTFVRGAVWLQEVGTFTGQSKRKVSLWKGRFSTETDSTVKDSKLLDLAYLLQPVQIIIVIYSDIQARLKTLLWPTSRCPPQLHRTHILFHIILLFLPQAPKIAEGKFLWLAREEQIDKLIENQQKMNRCLTLALVFQWWRVKTPPLS